MNPPDPSAGNPRRYAAVVAACENNCIGRAGQLPWRLPADLRNFRRITMHHHLVMGRKTLESIGRLLPGRTTVVLTRSADFGFPGAIPAADMAAVDRITAGDELPMIVGGGEIYRLFWPRLREIFLTRVHTRSHGDTFLPDFSQEGWRLVESEFRPADADNEFAITFQHYSARQ